MANIIGNETIKKLIASYNGNKEDLQQVIETIREHGITDDGLTDASMSFEQGYNNAFELVFKALNIDPETFEMESSLSEEIPEKAKESALKLPRFLRVSFFETPEAPYCWNGMAVQLEGDFLYGKLILLEKWEATILGDATYHVGDEVFAAEWQWNGGEELKGEYLESAKKLYEKYVTQKE